MQRVNGNRSCGFTLVELLVVIGIIAVLIGLLLPSLQKAREQAKTVQCLSNMRGIGQAIVLYAGANKGSFPVGQWDGIGAPDGTKVTSPKPASYHDWSTLLNGTIFTKTGAVTQADYLPANASNTGALWSKNFECPNGVPAADGKNNTGRVLHYASHPRLIPDLDEKDNSLPAKPLLTPYKLGKVKRSQEIILIFEAMQNLTSDYNCAPVMNGLDQDGLYTAMTQTGRKWNYLLNDGTPGVLLDRAINTPNKDFTGGSVPGAYAINNIRWRHGRNDATNNVYADGHAETRAVKLGRNAEIKVGNVYIDR